MSPPALELLAAAGLRFEAGDRALHVPCQNAPVDLLLLRPHDIPEYVQDGVVHLGITGANLVAEAQADVVQLSVPAAAPQQEIRDLAGLRVATAYPVSTRAALAALGVEAELVPVSGSVEAAPRLGLSDAIVDLVSTGSTASVNGLRRIGRLLGSEAVLIGNRSAKGELVERLQLMLEGVVAARNRRYVMLNASEEDLPAIRELLPGMGAPSVLPLAEPGQIAVHAAVEVDDIWELLPPLKAAGASSILVVPVERLVP
jgi:ATP phosphoribosyltransferase